MAGGSPSRQGAILAGLHRRFPACRAFHAAQRCARHMAARCRLPTARKSGSLGSLDRARRSHAIARAARGIRAMQFVDLSRELHHRTPAHPSHPPVVMAVWNDHGEVKTAGKTRFTSKSMALTLSDHSTTHVDAPCHFNPDPKAPSIDEVPLENFYTEA